VNLGAPYVSSLQNPGTLSFSNQSLAASSGQGSSIVLDNSKGQEVASIDFAITSASAAPLSFSAPEIDTASTASGIALLLGGLIALRSRKRFTVAA
jgi:hypothetical protein